MSLLQAADNADDSIKKEQVEEDEANEKHEMRSRFFEKMSGMTRSFHDSTTNAIKNQNAGPAQPMLSPGEFGEKLKGLAWNQLTGGPAGEYSRQMMGEGEGQEQDPQQKAFLESQPFYRIGGKLSQAIAGAAEWTGFGMVSGKLGRTLKPLTRFVPPALEPIVRDAAVNATVAGGATAATNKIAGRPQRDIPASMAIGGLLGATFGYFTAPEDMQAVQKNLPALQQAAGPDFVKGAREMQQVAGHIAGSEQMNKSMLLKRMFEFGRGKQDETLAAKIRMHNGSNPGLYGSSIMKKMLARANGSDTPAFELPKHGEIHNFFNEPQTGSTVMQEGAEGSGTRGPLGIPLNSPIDTANVQKHLANVLTDKGSKFKPATITSSRALTQAAMDGYLRPEHITRGDQASAISKGIFRTSRELEKSGDEGFTRHFEMGKTWARRARDLNAEPEVAEGKVNGASPTELQELNEAINKGKPRNGNASGPVKKPITKEIATRKRDARGRFC